MAERALKPERGHYPSVYPPNPAAELELEPEVKIKTDDDHVKFEEVSKNLKVAAAGLSSSSGPGPETEPEPEHWPKDKNVTPLSNPYIPASAEIYELCGKTRPECQEWVTA